MAEPRSVGIAIMPVRGLPEIREGDDLIALVQGACAEADVVIAPGDILVVAQKAVSKAEGRIVPLTQIAPSEFAIQYGERWGRDPRHVEVVLRESRRVVRMDRGIIISETHHGFVCANAGVDASNVPGDDTLCLLPEDPDRSACELFDRIEAALGFPVPVIVTDSFGRPWRDGIVNVAIGVAGLLPVVDYRGRPDTEGREMSATVVAVADEIASAAELAMGKVDRVPVVIVRGCAVEQGQGIAAQLVMPAERDMFR